jgi:hypothetical protein
MMEVFGPKSRQADKTKAFRVARAEITSQRRLSGEQLNVVASASTHVAVPLECCKVMF